MRSELTKVAGTDTIVRLFRGGIEDGWVDGWVIACGDEFVVIEIFDDACRPDGFNCFRFSDVTDVVVPSPRDGFLKRAIAVTGSARQTACGIEPSSIQAILCTGSQNQELTTIHLEEKNPGSCWIGQIQDITDEDVHLTCIDTDGNFHQDTEIYKLADITRVDFGSAYERVLQLVNESYASG
ncbi:MAG: hypothetical protein HRU11_12005 [Parvularculaceae bacterium]|nr:hypothetical protein [Parvularculaceae bacterium]